MSDENIETPESTLKSLKEEAESLGLEVHHRASEETIQNQINAYYAEQFKAQQEKAESPEPVAANIPDQPIKAKTAKEFAQERFAKRKAHARAMRRVRVTCMNPARKKEQGALVSTGSAKIGKIAKFIPFDRPWYVPNMLINMLEEAKHSVFYDVPDGQGGNIRKSRLVNTYAIEYLDPLTDEELKELAQRQRMRSQDERAAAA